MKTYWFVETTFMPSDMKKLQAETARVEKIAGRDLSSAGYGGGYRDVSWNCEGEQEARLIEKNLKAVGLEVWVEEVEDDD